MGANASFVGGGGRDDTQQSVKPELDPRSRSRALVLAQSQRPARIYPSRGPADQHRLRGVLRAYDV